jgi:hypothetical protein
MTVPCLLLSIDESEVLHIRVLDDRGRGQPQRPD